MRLLLKVTLWLQLFERYRSFASDSEREGISSSLQHMEEWLYEDGDDETEKVYTSKLEDLKKVNSHTFFICLVISFFPAI